MSGDVVMDQGSDLWYDSEFSSVAVADARPRVMIYQSLTSLIYTR